MPCASCDEVCADPSLVRLRLHFVAMRMVGLMLAKHACFAVSKLLILPNPESLHIQVGGGLGILYSCADSCGLGQTTA
jgi:hypothetical protein